MAEILKLTVNATAEAGGRVPSTGGVSVPDSTVRSSLTTELSKRMFNQISDRSTTATTNDANRVSVIDTPTVRNVLKNTGGSIENILKNQTTFAPIMPNVPTAKQRMHRPRLSVSAVNTKYITELPIPINDNGSILDGQNRIRGDHLDTPPTTDYNTFDGSRYAKMGAVPSDEYLSTSTGRARVMDDMLPKVEAIRAEQNLAANKFSATNTNDIEVGGGKEAGLFKSAAISILTSKPMSYTIELLGGVGDAMDVLGIMMLFTDAAFQNDAFTNYGQKAYPGYQPKLLTASEVSNVRQVMITSQFKEIIKYNKAARVLNATSDYNGTPLTYVTYPQISGPLDYLDRQYARTTVYDTKNRLTNELNKVEEFILRDKSKGYGAIMYDRMGSETYDAIVNSNGEYYLHWYVTGIYGNFVATEADGLFREAFTHICKYHEGLVYEDTHAGKDENDTNDPNMYGRVRLQCGWPDQAKCTEYSNKWVDNNGQKGGNYAEWFTWDDLIRKKDDGTLETMVPAAHPLRNTPGVNGACIVTNSGIRQVCKRARGNYDPVTHTCVFTPDFCQAIGTCYDTTTQMCFLPTKDIMGLSIFFGDGLPREFIRQNGCRFTSTPGAPADILSSQRGIYTRNDRNWQKDLSYNVNLPEKMRQLLASPTYAAGFATSVTGAAQGIGSATGLLSSAAARIGMTTLRLNVYLIVIQLAVMGATMLAEYMTGNQQKNQAPYLDERQFTVGGLNADGEPITLPFVNGWVTKPKALSSALTNVPGSYTCKFFQNTNDIVSAAGCATWDSCLTLTTTPGGLERTIDLYTTAASSLVPKRTCYSCENTPSGTHGILGGTKAKADKIWCIPQFPPDSYADNTFGPLATAEAGISTNKSWTNAKTPTWPQFPFGDPGTQKGAIFKPGDESSGYSQWYYQFVYDKASFGNANTATDGLPTFLWDTARLRAQFTDKTIGEMRKYYCDMSFVKYIKYTTKQQGPVISLASKCIGYLSVDFNNYKFIPMTILPRMTRRTA
jgi:hypothetical protein